MAVNEAKILYYRTDDGGNIVETIEMTDYLSASVKRTATAKNNNCDITLKNPIKKVLSSGQPIHKWINDDGTIIFKTPKKINKEIFSGEEVIEVFARRIDSASTFDVSSTSPYKLFTGTITEISGSGDYKKSELKLKLVDRTFVLMNTNGVGSYEYPVYESTLTGATSTTLTDSTQSWTTNELKGKVIVVTHSGTDYTYTITSNTATVITLRTDDNATSVGITTGDTYKIGWTTPSIFVDQINKRASRDSIPTSTIIVNYDFENQERYQVGSLTTNTITVSGASFTVDEFKDRRMYITSGTSKGLRANILSNDSDTITFYGTPKLITNGVSASDYFIICDVESGVETMRPAGSSYPPITFAKEFKPLHEWFSELSEVSYVNTAAEINDPNEDLVIKKPVHYYINYANVFFSNYVNNNPGYYLDITKKTPIAPDVKGHRIISRNLGNKVLENVNFIIFRYKDFDGVELLDFVFDQTSGSPTIQDSYRPYLTISNSLLKRAYDNGEISSAEYGATIDSGYTDGTKFPGWWNPLLDTSKTFPTSNSEYKTLFSIKALSDAKARAQAEINSAGNAQWSGTITLDFERFEVNEEINYTDYPIGIPGTDFRIKDISYSLTKSNMRTTITIEQDVDDYEKEI